MTEGEPLRTVSRPLPKVSTPWRRHPRGTLPWKTGLKPGNVKITRRLQKEYEEELVAEDALKPVGSPLRLEEDPRTLVQKLGLELYEGPPKTAQETLERMKPIDRKSVV